MNPEVLVLVMHRPTIHFDSDRADNVYRLLHEYVECRGIELPPSERDRRRPRTCFMTTSSREEATSADVLIEVGEVAVGVVREISADELLKKKTGRHLSRLRVAQYYDGCKYIFVRIFIRGRSLRQSSKLSGRQHYVEALHAPRECDERNFSMSGRKRLLLRVFILHHITC
jgi:hypothetical protein